MSNESTIISKVWNFAHVLRDDGVGITSGWSGIFPLVLFQRKDLTGRGNYPI